MARLEYKTNRFGDIVVHVGSLPSDPKLFRQEVESCLPRWQRGQHYGVWLKVPVSLVSHIPICCELGFKPHHANEKYFMMIKWFGRGSAKFPTFGTHNVGVSVLVLRYRHGRPQLLMVREKYARKEWNWKCVSGGVELGEFIQDAAVRELREETGLRGEFQSLVGVWNRKNTKFGRGEIHFGCFVELAADQDTDQLCLQEDEIVDAKWVDLEEALNNSVDDPRGIERYWIVSLLSSAKPQPPEKPTGLKRIQTSDFRGPSHQMHFHLAGWNQDLYDRSRAEGVLNPWNRTRSPPRALPTEHPDRSDPEDGFGTPDKESPTIPAGVREPHSVHHDATS